MSLASPAPSDRAARTIWLRAAAAAVAGAVALLPSPMLAAALDATAAAASASTPALTDGDDGVPDPGIAPAAPSPGDAAPGPDQDVTGSTAIERITRINLPQAALEGGPRRPPTEEENQAPGIHVGTFLLRPELTEGIGYETRTIGESRDERSFSQTTLRGTLTSDWSRHQLTVSGEGVWQENITGSGETEPSADVAADLRLDLADETVAHATGGYTFFREDTTDPNAIAGAASQSDVNSISGGVSLERSLGALRGRIGARAIRTTYGDVTLSDGSVLSQADRDTTAGEFTARVGYALSPAITPFIQATYLRTSYDSGVDAFGYRRSSDTYKGEAGVAIDLGEKLSGELAAGYALRSFEDGRLSDVSGLVVDGSATWSPHRGTNVSLDLITALEESTTPGESGPITYALRGTITRELRDNVVARLGGGYLYRNYVDGLGIADEQVYSMTAGFTWSLSRYLALDGDVSFERSRQPGAEDERVATVGLGLTVRR